MPVFAIHIGDDHGYVSSPVGAIEQISATSLEEAAEKLGVEFVSQDSRRIVTTPSLLAKLQDFGLANESLVLVQKD